MAECTFCGKGAGFMRSEHPDCRESYEIGKAKILEMTRKALFNTGDFDKLTKNVIHVADYSYIDAMEVQELLILGWEQAAGYLLSRGNLSVAAEERLLDFPEYFSFPALRKQNNATLLRIHQSREKREQAELEARKKREQAELRKKRERGKRRVIDLVRQHGSVPMNDNSLIRDINEVAEEYDLDRKLLGDALVEGWKEAVKDALNKTTLGPNEHERLVQFAVELTIPQSIVNESDELYLLSKKEQAELRERRRTGKELVIYLIRQHGASAIIDNRLTREIYEVAERYELNRELLDEAIIDGWEDAITDARQSGNVGQNEFDNLVQLAIALSIPDSIVEKSYELNEYRKKLQEKEQAKLREKRQIGKERVIYLIRRQGVAPLTDNSLIREINEAAELYDLDRKLLGDALVEGWKETVNDARQNVILRHNEYDRLVQLAEELSIPHSIVEKSYELNAYRKKHLFDILDRGMLPPGVDYAPGTAPFNLLKSETLIWLFENATIMNWDEVQNKHMFYQKEMGVVGVTNLHIYFAVGWERKRLSYKKIVSFDLTTEGILITQDNAKSTQLLLNTPDIDFTYDLVTRIANL